MSYLCYDVGGTFVKYATFDAQNHFLTKGKYPTHSDDPEQFFADMADIANQNPDVEAIGISFPGFIDVTTGVAVRAGALGQLDGYNLIDHFKAHLTHKVPVAVENDAKCAALAEGLNGNAQGLDDYAVLTLGTGVGCGLVVNGKLVHGKHFRAGEYGMSVTDFTTRGFATLHDMASTSALVRAYAKLKGIAYEDASGEQLMGELADPAVNQVVEDWADHVAVAIYNLVATTDPERILIGGGISKNPKILPFIEAALEKNPFWVKDYRTPVVLCKHDNDAGLLGALAVAQQSAK
ncbi:ROK family protein [Lacticaseibacillus kribbianus]|uniref:ROK family protein n=1 Tax=Lacticaseibacillus kribbianus TaxID=2926292 RepID=UPI001CD4B7A0|nr:ROK family protein [Lacticaseibacillus kribbianus]